MNKNYFNKTLKQLKKDERRINIMLFTSLFLLVVMFAIVSANNPHRFDAIFQNPLTAEENEFAQDGCSYEPVSGYSVLYTSRLREFLYDVIHNNADDRYYINDAIIICKVMKIRCYYGVYTVNKPQKNKLIKMHQGLTKLLAQRKVFNTREDNIIFMADLIKIFKDFRHQT